MAPPPELAGIEMKTDDELSVELGRLCVKAIGTWNREQLRLFLFEVALLNQSFGETKESFENTRAMLRAHDEIMEQLREVVVALMPEAKEMLN